MNLLIDLVPKKVEIEGIEYEINSDFRTSILFEMLIQDNDLSSEEKIINALELYYPVIPLYPNEAIEKILWFYRCGKDVVTSNGSKNNSKSSKVYDFDYDDEYIYSAFLDQYKIDLQDIKYLHWWKFKAMFKALKEDNEIVKIMKFRSVDLKDVKDKSEKTYYRKMKNLYKLPSKKNRIDFERLQLLEEKLKNGEDISNLL